MFMQNQKILVARFEGYVDCSLKNWKWLEQGRINNVSAHWHKGLKKLRIPQSLYRSYGWVKPNQKEEGEKQKVFTLKE